MQKSSNKLLEAAFAPQSLALLNEHYCEGKCLVLEGPSHKFAGLVTHDDIERRINDGCNASAFPQIIKDATRQAYTNSNCMWATASLNKTQFAADLQAGHSFMVPNSSQISRPIAQFTSELESFFATENVHADVHLYISTNAQGNSYHAHRDRPQHKLLLQAEGATQWQLFEPKQELADNVTAITPEQQDQLLETVAEFTLGQGDLLYMPPGTFHRVVAVEGPRISISIPFYSMAEASPMDRSFIPFKKVFAASAD